MIRNIALIVVVLALVSSCANRLSLVEGELDNGVRVQIHAISNLNYYNGQAHSLHLVMYELNSPTEFRQMINKLSERRVLLEGSWKHKSIISTKVMSIQPNEYKAVVFDRLRDSRYLGVVAGYYDKSDGASQTKLYSIDVYVENLYWIKAAPKQLLVRLNLGRAGFSD